MKWLIGAVLFLGAVAANDYDHCLNDVVGACKVTGDEDSVSCNSLLGGFQYVQPDLQSYVNSQLASSYDYLLLATPFHAYQKNRPGFYKLFKELSDKSWDKAVELIKHITKRGGKADFTARHEAPSTISHKKKLVEVDELHALSMALDSEKKLATEAQHIHRRTAHMDSHEHYDPEIAQFLEEEFLEYQSNSVRKISGYTNDLAKLAKVPDPTLSVFLFDEYLQKQ